MVLYFFMIIFCRYLKMTVEIWTGNERGGRVACNKSRWPDSNLGRCYVVTYVYHPGRQRKEVYVKFTFVHKYPGIHTQRNSSHCSTKDDN